jgi:hypothetical protein
LLNGVAHGQQVRRGPATEIAIFEATEPAVSRVGRLPFFEPSLCADWDLGMATGARIRLPANVMVG